MGATWSTSGKYGGAAQLNGTSGLVKVPDSPSLDLSSGMTLEAWVRPTSFSASQTLIAKERPGGGFPYGLELDNGVPTAYADTGTFGTASGTIKIHVQNILAKLGASDRTHAVTIAVQRGIFRL